MIEFRQEFRKWYQGAYTDVVCFVQIVIKLLQIFSSGDVFAYLKELNSHLMKAYER